MKEATLCFLVKENKVLLGLKKRGFGEGKWNGFGGKIEKVESIEEAVFREVKEECNLELLSYEKRAELEFYLKDVELKVHVYVADEWKGTIKESEEMKPQWFDIYDLPYDKMWEDDKYWLPLILKGLKIKGKFYFDKEDKLYLEIMEKWG